MPGKSTFKTRHHFVAQSDIRECPAHHNFVITAPRTIRIEVRRLDPMLLQIFSGWAISLDRTGRRNVICGYTVPEHGQDTGALDVHDGTGFARHFVEVRRTLNVR